MTFLQSFWSKIGHFSIFLFQVIQPRKMCFTIFQNEKTPVQAIKTSSSKSRKITIFAKGQSVVLVQNWPFFQRFILGNIGQGNVFYDILKGKNTFVGYKNKKLKKVEKLRIFAKGQSMVLVQNWQVFHLFILGNIGQENAFYNIVEQKKCLCRL